MSRAAQHVSAGVEAEWPDAWPLWYTHDRVPQDAWPLWYGRGIPPVAWPVQNSVPLCNRMQDDAASKTGASASSVPLTEHNLFDNDRRQRELDCHSQAQPSVTAHPSKHCLAPAEVRCIAAATEASAHRACGCGQLIHADFLYCLACAGDLERPKQKYQPWRNASDQANFTLYDLRAQLAELNAKRTREREKDLQEIIGRLEAADTPAADTCRPPQLNPPPTIGRQSGNGRGKAAVDPEIEGRPPLESQRRGPSSTDEWACQSCGKNNFARRMTCFKCRDPKPIGRRGGRRGPAAYPHAAAKTSPSHKA